MSVADFKEREDRLSWVNETLSGIEYQNYRAAIYILAGVSSLGVVLPFLNPNAESGISLFVRPALILAGILFLLLSVILLKKSDENTSLQENAALTGLVFSLMFPSFTYGGGWIGFGYSIIVFLLCSISLVGRRRIVTILFVSAFWMCAIFLTLGNSWSEF